MGKLRWVTNNFFTVVGTDDFYNIKSVHKFCINQVEYTDWNDSMTHIYERPTIKKCYVSMIFIDKQCNLYQCENEKTGIKEIEEFLKSRPCYVNDEEKISLS